MIEIVFCPYCHTLLEQSGDYLMDWYEDIIKQYLEEGAIKCFPNGKQERWLAYLESIGSIVTTESGEKSIKVKPIGVSHFAEIESLGIKFYEVCFRNCVKH